MKEYSEDFPPRIGDLILFSRKGFDKNKGYTNAKIIDIGAGYIEIKHGSNITLLDPEEQSHNYILFRRQSFWNTIKDIFNIRQ